MIDLGASLPEEAECPTNEFVYHLPCILLTPMNSVSLLDPKL